MKNKLTDLNDLLFAQLERLADDDLKGEAVDVEIKRAAAMVQVADKIVDNARLQLSAVKLIAEHGERIGSRLPMVALPSSGETKP